MKTNLKLVHSVNTAKRAERLIVGEIRRVSHRIIDRNKRRSRKCSTIDNAIIGLTRWMYQYGHVGDVCVIYHSITSLEVGTLKMTARGEVKTRFVYD